MILTTVSFLASESCAFGGGIRETVDGGRPDRGSICCPVDAWIEHMRTAKGSHLGYYGFGIGRRERVWKSVVIHGKGHFGGSCGWARTGVSALLWDQSKVYFYLGTT